MQDKLSKRKLIARKWYNATFPKIEKYFRKWIRCFVLLKSGLISMKKKKRYESAKNLYDVNENINEDEDKNENENENVCYQNDTSDGNKNDKNKNNSELRITQMTSMVESIETEIEMLSLEDIVNEELYQVCTLNSLVHFRFFF